MTGERRRASSGRGWTCTLVRYYHIDRAIEFTESAGKHGFTQADALWAMQHHIFVWIMDQPGVPEQRRPVLFVGPARSGLTIEVMCRLLADGNTKIFHAQERRLWTLALMNEEQ